MHDLIGCVWEWLSLEMNSILNSIHFLALDILTVLIYFYMHSSTQVRFILVQPTSSSTVADSTTESTMASTPSTTEEESLPMHHWEQANSYWQLKDISDEEFTSYSL